MNEGEQEGKNVVEGVHDCRWRPTSFLNQLYTVAVGRSSLKKKKGKTLSELDALERQWFLLVQRKYMLSLQQYQQEAFPLTGTQAETLTLGEPCNQCYSIQNVMGWRTS